VAESTFGLIIDHISPDRLITLAADAGLGPSGGVTGRRGAHPCGSVHAEAGTSGAMAS
jgi:hypothetical protein